MTKGDIFVVDDDPTALEVLASGFSEVGYRVVGFADGASFMPVARTCTPAGVVLDLVLPGRSGLDILDDINALDYPAPIFVSSGRGDIPSVVEAMRRGACDYLEKRAGVDAIVARVSDAISARQERTVEVPRTFPGHELLTPRERQVLALITAGASSQEAADHLGISRRTVEVHRASLLAKTKAKNTAELVRIAFNHAPVPLSGLPT